MTTSSALQTHAPESDLVGTKPEAGAWEPHTVHTHYFGFHIPEIELGCCIYVRYQPYFPLGQGGVCIFQGVDNLAPLDMTHLDYQIAMPYPTVEGNVIRTANGLTVDFLEPGRRVRLTYTDGNGVNFDVVGDAVTPLIARGAVVPGENLIDGHEPGGSEQLMHVQGQLTLDGATFDVDCYHARDRSWRQSRTEVRGGRHDIPFAWTPAYFADSGTVFNQVGFEDPDSDPSWAGQFEIPAGAPSHHFAWVYRGGELVEVTEVRRNVVAQHPTLHIPLRQEIDASDAAGNSYHLVGEAIACTPLPQWPNAAAYDSVFRWEESTLGTAYGPCQGVWYDSYQKLMKQRRALHDGGRR